MAGTLLTALTTPSDMRRLLRSVLLLSVTLALATSVAVAQDVERVSLRLLQEVMPEADRFDPADGDPPVKRAYRGDELLGFVFLTSDLPPEERGYSGPIRAVVGVSRDGVVTGMRVTSYNESYRYERGDFLGEPWLQEQFAGKAVGEPFSVGGDIDGISGVTISVSAMARGVRKAARRVALAYGDPPSESVASLSEEEVVALSWYEMQRRGLAVTMPVRQSRRNPFDLSLIHVSSDLLARRLMGRRYESFAEKVEEAGGADEIVVYAVVTGSFIPPLRRGWSIEQDGSTVEVPRERVVHVGTPGGALSGQASQVGALLLNDEDGVDIRAPLTFVFDRGRPEQGIARVEYTSRAALLLVAEGRTGTEVLIDPATVAEETVALAPAPAGSGAPLESAAPPESAGPGPADDQPAPEVPPTVLEPAPEAPAAVAGTSPVPADEAPASVPEPVSPTVAADPSPPAEAPAAEPPAQVDLEEFVVDEELAEATFGSAWYRVGWLLLVIALGGLAFLTKKPALRWVSLGTTMVVLGWIDGGFLSISHATGIVWVGLSAIRSDPSLLILTLFTLVTLLLWGRVFCGYLCPFGALQDFIDHFVPRRFKRELPPGVHRTAWKAKYLILAVILGAAIAGVEVSLYQYFEPFGTVFFIGTSALLWAIAGAFLIASAVIPRFYCRYVCPLGALLAVGSLVSLRRIPRVEQCDHCHVCERKCPTGAISGPSIDFAECVRCSVCEVQLIEQRGVCRHDMEVVRPRLVKLRREKVALK